MNKKENSIEKWKKEIVKTELAFAQMAQKEGISKAFLTYAAEDAVLMRNNSLIIGMESIRESFNNQKTEPDNNTSKRIGKPTSMTFLNENTFRRLITALFQWSGEYATDYLPGPNPVPHPDSRHQSQSTSAIQTRYPVSNQYDSSH